MPNRSASAAVLKQRLFQIVDALQELRMPYMVIGAFALPAWGRPRATLDLDFIIRTPEVPENLVLKLRHLGFHFDEEWDRYKPDGAWISQKVSLRPNASRCVAESR